MPRETPLETPVGPFALFSHQRQRLVLLCHPIGRPEEGVVRASVRSVLTEVVFPSIPFCLSLRSSLDISALVKTRRSVGAAVAAAVAAAAQMQLFLPPCRRSVCSIIGGGFVWSERARKENRRRLPPQTAAVFFATSVRNSRFREHPFVPASLTERVFRLISAYADQFDCALSLSCKLQALHREREREAGQAWERLISWTGSVFTPHPVHFLPCRDDFRRSNETQEIFTFSALEFYLIQHLRSRSNSSTLYHAPHHPNM